MRPASLRPCEFWERPGEPVKAGFFHQIVVCLLKVQDGTYSAHRALVEDENGQTWTVDVRNVLFTDAVAKEEEEDVD